MEDPYWIVDDAIIFKPSFNECLDNYVDIISKHPILIFSNYNDPNISLKNKNLFSLKDDISYKGSLFDQHLDNSLLNLINLQELTFGLYFNQSLGDSLSKLYNLRRLTLGNRFNQPLDNSLSNLVYLRELTFGWNFNQPLNDLLSKLDNLRELTLNFNFNQPLDVPVGIKKLALNCNRQYIIDYLPSSIEELELGLDFNLELNDLPSSIKKIKILNEDYDKKLNNLPNQIESLEISSRYKVQIDRKYTNLNVVYL